MCIDFDHFARISCQNAVCGTAYQRSIAARSGREGPLRSGHTRPWVTGVVGHNPPRMTAEKLRFGMTSPKPTATTAHPIYNKSPVAHRMKLRSRRKSVCHRDRVHDPCTYFRYKRSMPSTKFCKGSCQVPRRIRMIVEDFLCAVCPVQGIGFELWNCGRRSGELGSPVAMKAFVVSLLSFISGEIASQRALSASSTKSCCGSAWGIGGGGEGAGPRAAATIATTNAATPISTATTTPAHSKPVRLWF